jgi:hypothetical protein
MVLRHFGLAGSISFEQAFGVPGLDLGKPASNLGMLH